MRGGYAKSKFLEILSESPWISFACKKTGIARATIYRWMASDSDFRSAVEERIEHGRSGIYEAAEMVVLKRLKDNDLGAAKFVLMHNDPRYIPKRSIYVVPESELVTGGRCKHCGLARSKDVESKKIRTRSDELIEEYLKGCKCEKPKDTA